MIVHPVVPSEVRRSGIAVKLPYACSEMGCVSNVSKSLNLHNMITHFVPSSSELLFDFANLPQPLVEAVCDGIGRLAKLAF